MREIQRSFENARAAELAARLTHKPSSGVAITHVTLFDSENARLLPHRRITVRGERIVSVEAEHGQPTPAGIEIVDGKDKVLIPGLWDMHQQPAMQSRRQGYRHSNLLHLRQRHA